MATTAVVRFRRERGTAGPLFIGRDTHALSEPAFITALEVLHAAGVDVRIDHRDGFTPTPAMSHAILPARAHPAALADGIVVTPSHNPPDDGGFKYDPPTGGPADSATTLAIEDAANALLEAVVDGRARAVRRANAERHDFMGDYVDDLDWSSTWPRSASPGCASASTRSAARASPIGPRSRSATASP